MRRLLLDTNGHAAQRPMFCRALRLLSLEKYLELLLEVAIEPRDVTAIADALDLSVSVVSRGLRELAHEGVLCMRREGTHHIYQLAHDVLVEITGEKVGMRMTCAEGCEVNLQLPLPYFWKYSGYPTAVIPKEQSLV